MLGILRALTPRVRHSIGGLVALTAHTVCCYRAIGCCAPPAVTGCQLLWADPDTDGLTILTRDTDELTLRPVILVG